MRTERQTDITKLIVAFSDFAHALKKENQLNICRDLLQQVESKENFMNLIITPVVSQPPYSPDVTPVQCFHRHRKTLKSLQQIYFDLNQQKVKEKNTRAANEIFALLGCYAS